MAFNIEVVNTAALSVNIAERYTDFNGTTIATSDPNYVYDELRVNKVFFTIYDKLSTTNAVVYHRIKLWVNSPNDFIMDPTLPRAGSDYYISLIPLAKHNPIPALPSTSAGFSEAENTFLVTDTLANRVIGKLRRNHSVQNIILNFELQYQEDPMVDNTPAGRIAAGTWTTYTNATSENQIISDESDEFTQYRLRTVHTNENYIPGTDLESQGRLFVRDANKTNGISPLPSSLRITGELYTVQPTPQSSFPSNVIEVLFTDGSTANVPNAAVDFVLLLSDDIDGDTSVVNDVVTYITLSVKTYVDIFNHVTYRRGGTLVTLEAGTTRLKLFRGNDSSTKKTRIYTDLIWPLVGVHSYNMRDDNNETVDNNDGTSGQGNFGFWNFDAGQTRIGVNVDPVTNHVYLLVRLSKHSTTQFFNSLYLQMTAPGQNPMDGGGNPLINFDNA